LGDYAKPAESDVIPLRKGTLADFFAASPLVGSGLKIERLKGGFREIDFDALSEEAGSADGDPRITDIGGPPDRDG
jgi:hypothetical protein